MFQDWRAKLNLMNAAISAHNIAVDCSGSKKVNLFLDHEFITGFALMIGAGVYSDQGCNLWQAGAGSSKKGNDDYDYSSILQKPNYQWMKNYRFKEFRQFVTAIWRDDSRKNTDPWWEFVSCIEEFNQRRQDILETSVWWLIDECMSAYCPRKTSTGGLPNISYIERKPEPLGNVFADFY